jgi:hypothetical protein
MPRWTPKSPKESLQSTLDRLKARITTKKQELKEMEDQARQLEAAVKALG